MRPDRPDAWKQLPRAFIYPLTFESTLFIVLGGAMLWFFSTSLFGLPIVITIAIGFTQYLLLNLRHVALGGDEPPRITIDSLTQLGSTPIKLLLAAATWSSLAITLGTWSSHAATAMMLAGFLFLPAFTVLLALEDSLHFALNPVRLVKFLIRGGVIYMLFAGGLGLLLHDASVRVDLERLIFGFPPTEMLFRLMSGMYLATAASYALGRIAHVAHDFRAPEGHDVAQTETIDRDSPDVIADSLAKVLGTQDREMILQAWKAHEERDVDFQLALLDALRKQRAWPLVPWQAHRTITRLLHEHRGMDALRTALHTLTTHSTFATANADEWLRLCRLADECHRRDWLELLAGKAGERFPESPALVDIALLHARHLALKANDVRKARTVLEECRVPENHPRKREVEKFRQALLELNGS